MVLLIWFLAREGNEGFGDTLEGGRLRVLQGRGIGGLGCSCRAGIAALAYRGANTTQEEKITQNGIGRLNFLAFLQVRCDTKKIDKNQSADGALEIS